MELQDSGFRRDRQFLSEYNDEEDYGHGEF